MSPRTVVLTSLEVREAWPKGNQLDVAFPFPLYDEDGVYVRPCDDDDARDGDTGDDIDVDDEAGSAGRGD